MAMLRCAAAFVVLVTLCAAARGEPARVCVASCARTQFPIPSGWVADPTRAAVSSDHVLLAFALPNAEGAAELQRRVHELADPFSPHYKRYLSLDAITAIVQADREHADAVIAALVELGVRDAMVTTTGDWVRASMRVDAVARLFGDQCRPRAFVARGSPTTRVVRSLCALTLPAALARHVEYVHGLTAFPIPSAARAQASAERATSGTPNVTPQLLFSKYNVTAPAPSGTNVSQGCAEFEHESWSQPDLSVFEKHYRLATAAVTTVGHSGLGKTEANLDVQYITAMAQGVPTTMWLAAGYSFNLVAWAQDVLAAENAPLVWSISYGEDSSTVDAAYAQQLDAEFVKFAGRGVSVLFASGDSGVWSRGAPQTGSFQPTFPASLPHVTAVGATQMNSDGVEDSSTDWSGGGFSLAGYFDRATDAPWQVEAVEGYLNMSANFPPADLFNGATGVAFPDVSALGVNFEVIMGLIPTAVSGTSCASPTFAGVIALINAHLLAQGEAPLGFLNPWLYKVAAPAGCLHDITQGYNSNGAQYGLPATVGFDAVTGLGTPNAGLLLQSALALSR